MVNYTGTIPAATISALTGGVSGQRTIFVRAIDVAGNQRISSFPVFVDKQAPSLTIMSHTDSAVVNKTITISGNASDTQGLAGVEVFVTEDGSIDENTVWTTLGSGGTTWSVTLNTLTQLTASFSGNVTVKAVATDEAGNTTEETVVLNVDQDSDKPIITLNNIDLSGATRSLKLSRIIYGNISDDDGAVTSLKISVDNTNWDTVTVSGGSWSYSIPGSQADGTVNLYFDVKDNKGTDFKTGTGLSPKIVNSAEPSGYQETMAVFTLDTIPPTIGTDYISIDRDALDFTTKENFLANMAIGGSNNTIRLRTLALDSSDIQSVIVSIEGYTGAEITSSNSGTEDQGGKTYEVWDTGNIVLTGANITDGIKTVTIKVTDKSGLESTVTRGLRIDNTAPTLTYQGPSTLEQGLTGNVEVKGLAGDTGSGLSKVEYKIGYNHGKNDWTEITENISAWTIPLINANRISNFAGRLLVAITDETLTIYEHGFSVDDQIWLAGTTLPTGLDGAGPYYVKTATADTITVSDSVGGNTIIPSTAGENVRISNYSKPKDGLGQIWNLPILFKVTDLAGNILETNETSYVLQVDPTGDIPKIAIVYPDPTSTERTLGGTIRIFGTSQDNISVDKVYMQVTEDTSNWNYQTDETTPFDWYNGDIGIEVNGTVSWNYSINTRGEFDPTGSETRPIYFRVRVKDNDGQL
jgi:large repetitive protein